MIGESQGICNHRSDLSRYILQRRPGQCRVGVHSLAFRFPCGHVVVTLQRHFIKHYAATSDWDFPPPAFFFTHVEVREPLVMQVVVQVFKPAAPGFGVPWR